MAKLRFGPTWSNTGFTSGIAAEYGDARPARAVRELIQNSIDAALEAGVATARMRFELTDVERDEIPDLDGLAATLDKARRYQERFQGRPLSDASCEVVTRMEAALSDRERLPLLTISDNGVGFDDRRMGSILADGSSAKVRGAGSYGVGHLSFMGLSDLRYVLYGGLTACGTRTAAGTVLLASHRSETHLNEARGLLVAEFLNDKDGRLYRFLDAGEHPPAIKRHLDRIARSWGHGAVVLIPAFNHFRRKRISLWELVSRVAAHNFAPAIFRNRLEVSVTENGKQDTLSAKALGATLRGHKDRKRSARSDSPYAGLRPSGGHAYSIFEALRQKSSPIELETGRVRLSLKTPSHDGNTRVDLFRHGMWITDRVPELRSDVFTSSQPFQGVIEIDGPGDELYRLVRKAEGPMHDRLDFALLSIPEKTDLSKALGSLRDRLKELVPAVRTHRYTVPDVLAVPTADVSRTGEKRFALWGRPTVVPRVRIQSGTEGPPPGPDGPKREGRRRRKRPKQRPTRPLGFRSVVVPEGPGRLVGSLVLHSACAEAFLRVRWDENTDSTCDRVWHDEFVSLEEFALLPNEPGVPPPVHEMKDGGVHIQGLRENAHYRLQVGYRVPAVARPDRDQPVFRIEMLRPAPGGVAKGRRQEEAGGKDR